MLQVIYASAARRLLDKDELRSLLTVARRNNTSLGVSGMLLHDAGSFLQVIEGPPEAVTMLMARIGSDPRHHRVVTLLRTTVQEATFPDWTMGFATVDRHVMAAIPGFADLFALDRQLCAEHAEKAWSVIRAFRDGRWRTYVDR